MPDIHLDAVGGIAGDMFAAALLDAFPALQERVLADARAVLPANERVRLEETSNGTLRALQFGLAGGHDHRHRDHHHDESSGSFPDLVNRIQGAPLQPGTAAGAVSILTLLAEVEAQIHRVPIEAVHFHEIAGWDSLLDVVAAGSIAAALPGAGWTVSALPRGGGLVRTQHGLLPIPAPATAALLTGFVWRDDGIEGERVTPTGAAILRHLVGPAGSGAALSGRLAAVGTGAGSRVLPGLPNVLRALVFEGAAPFATREQVTVIGFEIDDMTGEEIAVAADRLRLVEGVLDLTIGHVQGKKGRAMHAFRLLVRPDRTDAAIERCFLETSTIGLRFAEEGRAVLPRHLLAQRVDGASVGLKVVQRAGRPSAKAESDDLTGEDLESRRRLKQRAELEAGR
jgi:hypothetical protein